MVISSNKIKIRENIDKKFIKISEEKELFDIFVK